jgi:hypothetical protein
MVKMYEFVQRLLSSPLSSWCDGPPWSIVKNAEEIVEDMVLASLEAFERRGMIAVHPTATIEAGAVVKEARSRFSPYFSRLDRRFNPVTRWEASHAVIRAKPRCGAWARSAERPCKQPVVAGKNRCWLHGGKNRGAPAGNKNNLSTGAYTPEQIAARRQQKAAARTAKAAVTAAVKAAEKATARLVAGRGLNERRARTFRFPGSAVGRGRCPLARPSPAERKALDRRKTEKQALRAANADRDAQVHQRVQQIVDRALARSSQAGEAIPDLPVLLRELEEARLGALSVYPPQSLSGRSGDHGEGPAARSRHRAQPGDGR